MTDPAELFFDVIDVLLTYLLTYLLIYDRPTMSGRVARPLLPSFRWYSLRIPT